MSTPTDSTPVLNVNHLSVDYITHNRPPAHALDNVSFQLRRGEMLGVVGESGCGKSTLMLALMRLLPAAGRITHGQINFQDCDLLTLSEYEMADVRWRNLSMIFQGAMNALNPVRTVGSQIAEPILRHQASVNSRQSSVVSLRSQGSSRQSPVPPPTSLDQRVNDLLTLVGIPPDRRNHYPHQYSGGMRQRAMIAMALACNPDVVIADEPTTALDVMVQAQILELLATLRKQLGLAVILVTHDLGVVAEVCDSVLVMYGGVVAEYADVDTIFNRPQHPYTKALLQAFPDLSRKNEKLVSIPGSPPRLDALPPGCRFAPRCSAAFARCHQEVPTLYQAGKAHQASCFGVEEHQHA